MDTQTEYLSRLCIAWICFRRSLFAQGYDLRAYDKNVQLAKLVGPNREFILNRNPHIAAIMVDDIGVVLEHGQTIVIGSKDPGFRAIPERLQDSECIVDFVRIANLTRKNGEYECIC